VEDHPSEQWCACVHSHHSVHRVLCCWATRTALEGPLWGFSPCVLASLSHEAWQGELHTVNTPQPHSELHYHSSVRRGQLLVDGSRGATGAGAGTTGGGACGSASFAYVTREPVGSGFALSAAGGGGEARAGGGPGHETGVPCGVHHMELRTRRAVLSSGTTAVGRTP
jgi:hypothetical protein